MLAFLSVEGVVGRVTNMVRNRLALLASLALLLTASGVAPAAPAAAPLPGPCGGAASAPATYDHVVVIAFENKSAALVYGKQGRLYADYINSLADACAKHVSYAGDSAYPSLPQYLEATAGTTARVVSDCSPSVDCQADAPSIFGQVGWRVFAEGMPAPCTRQDDDATEYAVHHNPAVYFTTISPEQCALADRPLPPRAPPFLGMRLTWITPDLCHDMHSACATPTEHFPNGCTDPALDRRAQRDCRVESGDEWLQAWLPSHVLETPTYEAGRTVVFLWWDEGSGADPDLVPLVAVAPSVPAGTVAAPATVRTHVDFLRTLEALTGKPCLPSACAAADMRSELGLG